MTQTEKGVYSAFIKGSAFTNAKSGSPQFELTLEVTHILRAGQWADILPLERRMYLSCADGAWPYTEQKLETLVFNGEFGPGAQFTANSFKVICDHQEYNGKLRERWDLAEWGNRDGEPVEAEVAMRFKSKWGARKRDVPAPPPPATEAPGAAGPPSGNRIPF